MGRLRELAKAMVPSQRARRLLRRAYLLARVPKATAEANLRPGRIVVAGFLSTASGIGESARLCLRALDALGTAPLALDISPGFGMADTVFSGAVSPTALDDAGTLIIHANGPEFLMALAQLGRRRLRHRRVIGYWAWELPVFPEGWETCQDYLHELWVPSLFVRDALRQRMSVPIRVVPHPVFEPPAMARPREVLGLPEDRFVVLSMFDLRSSFERKNPLGIIEAFRRAFGDDPGVLLLLKARNVSEYPSRRRQLDQAMAGLGNVRLMTEVLDQMGKTALVASADVLFSPHRSEGFGLTLAEAMALGKPVVATAWSGNMDFMDESCSALIPCDLVPVTDADGIYNAQGAVWAEPDVDEAARWLRRLRDSPELRERLGSQARLVTAAGLGLAAYGEAVTRALETT